MTQPLRIPDWNRLPWTAAQYPEISEPSFWSNREVFQKLSVLRWSRFGCLFLETTYSQGAGPTVTYAFMDNDRNANPSNMLRTLSRAGWKILSFPDTTSFNGSVFGELIFDPDRELDEDDFESDDEIDDAADEADSLQQWYRDHQPDFYSDD